LITLKQWTSWAGSSGGTIQAIPNLLTDCPNLLSLLQVNRGSVSRFPNIVGLSPQVGNPRQRFELRKKLYEQAAFYPGKEKPVRQVLIECLLLMSISSLIGCEELTGELSQESSQAKASRPVGKADHTLPLLLAAVHRRLH